MKFIMSSKYEDRHEYEKKHKHKSNKRHRDRSPSSDYTEKKRHKHSHKHREHSDERQSHKHHKSRDRSPDSHRDRKRDTDRPYSKHREGDYKDTDRARGSYSRNDRFDDLNRDHDRDSYDERHSQAHIESLEQQASAKRHRDEDSPVKERLRPSGDDSRDFDHKKKGCSPSRTRESRKAKDSDPDDVPDYEFDWDAHKYVLRKMFFSDDDPIKGNSKEFDDFWSFLEKYKAFHLKKALKSKGAVPSTSLEQKTSSKFDLPLKYDKRYRINIALAPKETKYIAGAEDRLKLPKHRIQQFKQILIHFLDFQQKQKLTKLQKIRKDQEQLPMYQHKQEVLEALEHYQVIVIAGDTGCGKSTQVPQYLLEGGYNHIACTQPRRIACVSLCKRVAYETLNEYGSQVGYQIRFEKTRTMATRIVFLTEGLLLRQMSTDTDLSQYSVVVIDEVHERHIHTDFLLGVMKCLMHARSDIKIILMSATININLFSSYFDDALVIQVPGRLFPIQLHYSPISPEEATSKSERLNPSPYIRILQVINKKYPDTERGDVLIFLSGLTEIMTVAEAAKAYSQATSKWIILPLHSSLSVEEQDKVFDIAPEGVRKCIISTNIAETSVTIDGVRFVVDSGKVKEMSFDSKCKMQRLQEFWISRASAEQRKGRAGRTGPGVCYRLFTESDYNSLQDYSTPEIQRVPLDSLILQLISMGLPDARKFPFIEPPAVASVESSIAYLKELGALSPDEQLTATGEMLSQLPVDVSIGKMLIMGAIFHMVEPVLSVSAALSVQSPFTNRAHTDFDAVNKRKDLESNHGDPFTLLNAFDEWVEVKAKGENSKRWCKRRGLEEQRFYEMTKLKKQFKDLLNDHGMIDSGPKPDRYLTSTERRLHHANRKQLRDLRKDQRRQKVNRKVLKLEEDNEVMFEGQEDKEEMDMESKIKDLEFRLTHNLDSMHEEHERSRQLRVRDINLMKVILCSGLYPNLAIADEHNSNKADSEQAFHTRGKPYVLLHPTSVFATDPEPLELDDKDVHKTNTEHDSRYPYSHKHQLLAYLSLLETTKPYLTGTMRVPALQTIMLYATSIDTNTDCTRFVCDGWIELRLLNSEEGESILTSVVTLRSTWQALAQAKLQAHKESELGDGEFSRKAHKLERLLAKKLAEYLDSHLVYSMKRLLAADLKNLYTGTGADVDEDASSFINDLCKECKPHPTKGGVQVNDYLTFNCLIDDDSAYGSYSMYMQKHWTCPRCGVSMVATVIDRLAHEQSCAVESVAPNQNKEDAHDASIVGDDTSKPSGSKDSLRSSYHCDICGKDLKLTTTEILKHKRHCKP